MIRNIFVGILKGITLLALTAPAVTLGAALTELRGIEVSSAGNGARVVLDTSGTTGYSVFTLDKPSRVVIDLRNTQIADGVRMPAGIGAIENVRTGVRPGGTLRVVVEVKSAMVTRGQWSGTPVGVGKQLVVGLGKNSRVALAAMSDNSVAPILAASSVPTSAGISPPRATSTKSSAVVATPGAGAPSPVATPVIAPSSRIPAVITEKTAPIDVAPKPLRPAHAPIDSDRDIVIAVDAGHGGQDPGAIGRNGTQEKSVTLAIARSLAARINAEPGMRATLIRDGDYFVVLRDRMVRARSRKADLFVSIHADAIRDRSITGASVYVLSDRGASSEAARWLAERENAADLMGGVKLDDKDESLASVLLDLSQMASLTASMTAAERVLAELDRSVDVRKPRVQQAGLIVLKSPDIPSLLIETGYISNPGEESRLKSERHQARLADTIFTGLRGYFEVNPPPGTRLARTRRSTLAGVMATPTTP